MLPDDMPEVDFARVKFLGSEHWNSVDRDREVAAVDQNFVMADDNDGESDVLTLGASKGRGDKGEKMTM